MNHSCFARIRKSGTFREPRSSKFCSPWIVASGETWPGRRTWAAAPTSAVRLEAPPADELELVVFVMAARGAGAGRIDIAEVGFREVPAEGEREGARRPPETNLRLPVVDAEEGRAG